MPLTPWDMEPSMMPSEVKWSWSLRISVMSVDSSMAWKMRPEASCRGAAWTSMCFCSPESVVTTVSRCRDSPSSRVLSTRHPSHGSFLCL